MSALLLLLGVLASANSAPPPPLLVFGPGGDPETADAARRDAEDAGAEPRWFLEASPAPLPGVHLLGGGATAPCAGAATTEEELRAAAAEAFDLLDLVLPDEASAAYEAVAARLPCLAEPPQPAFVAELQFNRAIAALTRPDRDADLGRRAFEAAFAADPDLPWNEDYSAFPRSVFFEAKVRLLTTERARLRLALPESVEVYLQGRPVGRSVEGDPVLAGVHVLHVRAGDTAWRGELTLEPGDDVVVGDPEALWALTVGVAATDADVARAYVVRSSVAAGFGGAVRVTRPGGVAVVGADGELGGWSDEAPYVARPRVEVGGGWTFLERTIDSPPLDSPLPGDHHAIPRFSVGVQVLPALYARFGAGVAFSGPFEVEGVRYTRLLGVGQVGVGIERPEGFVRPGGRVDLNLLFAGPLDVGGERVPVVLVGPTGTFTVGFGPTDRVRIQVEVGGGWIGSPSLSAGAAVQLRPPPASAR